jgi:4,5-DOPA dioxygenase extradiol
MTRTPVLFVSHGSPMFALTPGLLGPNLQRIGQSLRDVRAILVVSPHWQTHGIRVATTDAPETIHDFGGFPQALFALQYRPRGAPKLATETADLLAAAGFDVVLDPRRGLDHGAWVPLRYLAPAADVPVFQVSLPFDVDAAGALRMGQALATLRDRGVLIVGSGSLTHNLHEFRQHIRDPEYAQQFADWIADAVLRRDTDGLLQYRTRAPHAVRAHPTEEHYLPLLVAIGASRPDDRAERIEGGMTDGTLSMDSFGFGLPRTETADASSAR